MEALDRVGITSPSVEVRFENLKVEAECYVGGRAVPTLWNAARNAMKREIFGGQKKRVTTGGLSLHLN